MSEKNNSTVDNSNLDLEHDGQSVDDARHKRDMRNDAVQKSVHGSGSKNDGSDSSETPPPTAASPEAAETLGKTGGAAASKGANSGAGADSSAGGGRFGQMADRLEQAGQKAKDGARAVSGGAKAAGNVAGRAAKGAAGALQVANALSEAARDPAEAVKLAGSAVGGAVMRKVLAFLAPVVFKILVFILCAVVIVMPFALIFGFSDSEPTPEEIAAAEVARERGDKFDIVDWSDSEQTFDWLLAEMSKSRQQLTNVTGNEARDYANNHLSQYAEKWEAEDEEDYTYRLRYNQSEIEMQKDVASLICAMYSVSQSSGGENESFGEGDGEGFIESTSDDVASVDVKGDYKGLLRQASKLAIKTYKVELIYPTGGRVLIYPAGINIQIGWSDGPYFSGDWTSGIDWAARDAFYADGSFVETREVSVVADGVVTDETEEKTFLTQNCIITVDIDLRDEFFDELVKYFDMELPAGMDPAAEYRARRNIYTSAGGWEGYMENENESERGMDPDVQPSNFETALDASFHFLYSKGVTLTNSSGGDGSGGGETLSFGDIKAYIEEHANNTSSTLVFPEMLPVPCPSYWSSPRYLFLEERNGYRHQGTDTPAGNESVTAGAPGEIVKIVDVFAPGQFAVNGSAARGNLVIIYYGEKSDGVKVYMVFQHLNTVSVGTGDSVSAGTELGIVGNTGECYGDNGGYHLHTETHYVYNTGGFWTGATAQNSDNHFNR